MKCNISPITGARSSQEQCIINSIMQINTAFDRQCIGDVNINKSPGLCLDYFEVRSRLELSPAWINVKSLGYRRRQDELHAIWVSVNHSSLLTGGQTRWPSPLASRASPHKRVYTTAPGLPATFPERRDRRSLPHVLTENMFLPTLNICAQNLLYLIHITG